MFSKVKRITVMSMIFFLFIPLLTLPAIQEVNIKGIPEINNNNITWNMSINDVYSCIKGENKFATNQEEGYETNFIFCFDDFFFTNDCSYNIQIYEFNDNKLASVQLIIPEEEMEKARVYLVNKYGAPSNMGKIFICKDTEYKWYSDETTIIAYEALEPFGDDNRKALYVAYYYDMKDPYRDVQGSIRTIDPYTLFIYRGRDISEFISDNKISEYTKTEYISGFEKANFIKYSFSMFDSYLGFSRSQYSIEISTDKNSTTATLLSYVFKWENQKINKLPEFINKIVRVLSSIYETKPDCSYTSMYYNNTEIKKVDLNTIYTMIAAQTQGIYDISYKNDYYAYSLNISISPNDQYTECILSVS